MAPLLRLERQIFSSWFRWLISPSRPGIPQSPIPNPNPHAETLDPAASRSSSPAAPRSLCTRKVDAERTTRAQNTSDCMAGGAGDSQQREFEKLLTEVDSQLAEAASIAEANGGKGGCLPGLWLQCNFEWRWLMLWRAERFEGMPMLTVARTSGSS